MNNRGKLSQDDDEMKASKLNENIVQTIAERPNGIKR
jgi:hypothetical protein